MKNFDRLVLIALTIAILAILIMSLFNNSASGAVPQRNTPCYFVGGMQVCQGF